MIRAPTSSTRIDTLVPYSPLFGPVVRGVMVPRPDMVTVTSEFRVADAMEVVILNGYSRIPACGQGIDDIVGIVHAKDLMRAERDGNEERTVAEERKRNRLKSSH